MTFPHRSFGIGRQPAARPALSRPMPRPTLLPGLRRLWRGRRSLQLGVDPSRAVILELPDAGLASLLDLLDGTRSERTVLAEAQRYGIAAADAQALLDSLCEAGLVVGAQCLLPQNLPDPVRQQLAAEAAALALSGLAGPAGTAPATPAQVLRRRAAARVAVTGQGRLVTPVAMALAEAGIGHVWAAGDRAAGEAIARTAPATRTAPLRRRETTVMVSIGHSGPADLAAAGYSPRRVAHLVLLVRDGIPVVGPLVPPGGRPCLACLDLHRQDRDPQWPMVAGQLVAVRGGDPCAAATGLAAAGLAAGEVLAWVDGANPATVGASIEVAGPGRLRRRSWPPHPHCHCLGSGTMAR